MTDEPKITIELRKHGAILKIEGKDEAELEKGLAEALGFVKRNEKKLKTFDVDSHATVSDDRRDTEEMTATRSPEYIFPDWFPFSSASVSDAVATVMYDLNQPLTTGEIAKILTKAWKPMDVRNVSKLVTMRGKYLAPYVYREQGRKLQLTSAGRKWYENEVLPRLNTAG